MCHCLCLFQSYQLFLCVGVCVAGLWQCVMLSLVVSECVGVGQLHASMSMCLSVAADLAIHGDPSPWLGSSGAAGGKLQWSAVVLYLPLLSPLQLTRLLAG